MARRAVTIEVDERLLEAARAVAERAGVPADGEGVALAYDELRAAQAERRTAS